MHPKGNKSKEIEKSSFTKKKDYSIISIMQLNKNYLLENIEYTFNFELIHDIIIDIILGENMSKIYLENKEITFSGKSVRELVIEKNLINLLFRHQQ